MKKNVAACAGLVFLVGWTPLVRLYFQNAASIYLSFADLVCLVAAVALGATIVLAPVLASRRMAGAILSLLAWLAFAGTIATFFVPAERVVMEGAVLSAAEWTHAPLKLGIAAAAVVMGLLSALRPASRPARVMTRGAVTFACAYAVIYSGVAAWQLKEWRPKSKLFHVLAAIGPDAGARWPLSSTRNVLVLSFDSMQGSVALGVLKRHPELAAKFDGFQAFSNVTSVYPNTPYSIASVLTGRIPRVKEDTLEAAMAGPNFVRRARAGGYAASIGFADANCDLCDSRTNRGIARRQLLHEFRLLAAVALVQGYGVSWSLRPEAVPIASQYWWSQDIESFRQRVVNVDRSSDRPVVEFRHYFATHEPALYTADCTIGPEAAIKAQQLPIVESSVQCVLASVTALIDRLKAEGLYDRTALIVTSDHGYDANLNRRYVRVDGPLPLDGRDFFFPGSGFVGTDNLKAAGTYNPTLLFKDFDRHGLIQIDSSPVSLLDIAPTACETLDGCGFPLEGLSLRQAKAAGRPREYWRYVGGSADRFKDGQDRLHDGLGTWWQIRSFTGDLTDLARSMFGGRGGVDALNPHGPLFVRQGGDATQYTLDGFARPEPEGTWTTGKRASLLVPTDAPYDGTVRLMVKAQGFLSPSRPAQTVRIRIDGHVVGAIEFTRSANDIQQAFAVPPDAVRQMGPIAQVDFETDDVVSRGIFVQWVLLQRMRKAE